MEFSLTTITQNELLESEKESLRLMKEAGINVVDYSLVNEWKKVAGDVSVDLDDFLGKQRQKYEDIRKYADSIGIRVGQTHALYPATKILDVNWNPRAMKLFHKAIEVSSVLGSPYIVIHPVKGVDSNYGHKKEEFIEKNIEFYSRFTEDCRKYNIKIALENMFGMDEFNGKKRLIPCACSTAEEMIRIIDAVNAKAGFTVMVACLDTGHSNITNEAPWDMICALGFRLKVLHVHDSVKDDDLHTVPYMGNINWDKTLNALAASGYDGTFNFEVCAMQERYGKDYLLPVLKFLRDMGETMIEKYNLGGRK